MISPTPLPKFNCLSHTFTPTQRSVWPTPESWRTIVDADNFELLYINTTLPNNNGTWPEELGGPIYPPELGHLSRLFHEQLLADCPGCPHMPDPEKGSDAAAAAAIRSESYLFAPRWLVTSWWYRGRVGLWGKSSQSIVL